MKRVILIIFLTGLTSCTTSLSKKAYHLKMVQSYDEVKHMEFLGEVNGSSPLTGANMNKGRQNALNECKNEAAELGATHLHIISKTGHYMSWSMKVKGMAYKEK